MTTFNVGDKVKCNGNPNGTIVSLYLVAKVDDKPLYMYVVRLRDDFRIIGEAVVSERDLLLEN